MKFSRETLKLSENMTTGFTMPAIAAGNLEGDHLSDKSFKILQDAGINLVNCDKVQISEKAKDMADRRNIGLCSVENNILPLGKDENFADYENNLRKYCQDSGAKLLSFVNPLYSNIYEGKMTKDEAYRNFVTNAALVNKLSKEFNIPYWGSVQAGGNFELHGAQTKKYYPSDSEFLWMVNLYLAAGAKGIQYYPLIEQNATMENGESDLDRNGILGADKLPTIYWSYARTANEQLRDAGPMLIQSRSEALIATGEMAELLDGVEGVATKDIKFRQLKSIESSQKGVIIGCLDFKHRTGFYIVNCDLERRREVTLNFDGPQTVVVTQLGNKQSNKKEESVTLGLQAGGAALVYLWKHLGD